MLIFELLAFFLLFFFGPAVALPGQAEEQPQHSQQLHQLARKAVVNFPGREGTVAFRKDHSSLPAVSFSLGGRRHRCRRRDATPPPRPSPGDVTLATLRYHWGNAFALPHGPWPPPRRFELCDIAPFDLENRVASVKSGIGTFLTVSRLPTLHHHHRETRVIFSNTRMPDLGPIGYADNVKSLQQYF